MNNTLVFVYGTLLKGEGNSSLLRNSRFVSSAVVEGELFRLGGFPTIMLNDKGIVYGEVYEVDADTLDRLDYLEGYRPGMCSLYNRQVTTATLESGISIPVLIYELDKPYEYVSSTYPKIKSGNWRMRN